MHSNKKLLEYVLPTIDFIHSESLPKSQCVNYTMITVVFYVLLLITLSHTLLKTGWSRHLFIFRCECALPRFLDLSSGNAAATGLPLGFFSHLRREYIGQPYLESIH